MDILLTILNISPIGFSNLSLQTFRDRSFSIFFSNSFLRCLLVFDFEIFWVNVDEFSLGSSETMNVGRGLLLNFETPEHWDRMNVCQFSLPRLNQTSNGSIHWIWRCSIQTVQVSFHFFCRHGSRSSLDPKSSITKRNRQSQSVEGWYWQHLITKVSK